MNGPEEQDRNEPQRSGGNGSAATHPGARELVEQSQRVREDLQALANTARGVAQDWEQILRARLERQPYATLALAAGVGYVLGGGVPTGVIRLLLGMGSRLAIEQAVLRLLASQVPER